MCSTLRVLLATCVFLCAFPALAQFLTVQIGNPPPAPLGIVAHDDIWQFRRGTNEPQADWRTVADSGLDNTWLNGPGGFGYGDPNIQGENTTITGMRDVHSSLYVRREFQIAQSPDPAAELRLVIDYDDGFVAYLDGVEILRRNLAGASNSPVANTAFATAPHEASCCTGTGTNSPSTVNLGPVGNRLAAGSHVLAIIGLNDDINSSDFHIIADLILAPAQSSEVFNNGAYALITTDSMAITGTNTVPGSTRVTINGDDVTFNPTEGTWSVVQPFQPGWNRLYIAALDSTGNLLANLVQDVVYETSRTSLSGTVSADTRIAGPGTVLHVTGNVTVAAGATLEIADGVIVLVEPGRSIIAQAGGTINVLGTAARKVFFSSAGSGNGLWGPLSATGDDAEINVRFADVSRAQVSAVSGAAGLVEDVAIHDFDPGSAAGTLNRPIMMCNFASLFQARRVHVWNYYECLVRNGIIQIEDCVFEKITGDALDFDSAQPGSYTRRCTYRDGTGGNVDAIDIGPADLPGSTDTVISDCIMWNFPRDKGVSVGDNGSSHGIIVSNCLIYACNAGVMSKDLCDVSVRNCTIVNNTSGLTNFNKLNPSSPTGGGITTNTYNNILWNNIAAIGMANNGQLYADHNDFGNTNWPGEGNIDIDPLFVNPAAHDFRLQPGSPVRGAGRDGADMGVTFPIGGIPLQPLQFAVLSMPSDPPTLKWIDDSQNEDAVVVQRSTDGLAWTTIATLPRESTNHVDSTAPGNRKLYYRVQHTNYVGVSPFSNVASGTREGGGPATEPVLHIGLNSGEVTLEFAAEANVSYTVEFKNVLETPNWSTLTNIAPADVQRSILITNTSPDPARYYRAVIP